MGGHDIINLRLSWRTDKTERVLVTATAVAIRYTDATLVQTPGMRFMTGYDNAPAALYGIGAGPADPAASGPPPVQAAPAAAPAEPAAQVFPAGPAAGAVPWGRN